MLDKIAFRQKSAAWFPTNNGMYVHEVVHIFPARFLKLFHERCDC